MGPALGGRPVGPAPAVMIPLFLACFYGLYLSDAANVLLRTGAGHVSLEILFLVAGILFTVPILSTDPLPSRQSHTGRMIDLAVEMPLHAFFGVIIMMAPTPLIGLFADPPATWGVDPVRDQGTAGGLAWAYGEGPTLVLLLILLGLGGFAPTPARPPRPTGASTRPATPSSTPTTPTSRAWTQQNQH